MPPLLPRAEDNAPAASAAPDLAAVSRAVVEVVAALSVSGPATIDSKAEATLRSFLKLVGDTLAAMKRDRAKLDEQIPTVQDAVDVVRRLLGEPSEAPHAPERPRRPEGYSPAVVPIAEALIRQLGPVTVADIYRALSAEARAEIAAVRSRYTPEFRLRRMFRRHAGFFVERKTGLVSLAPQHPDAPVRLRRIVQNDSGRLQALEIVDAGGVRAIVPRSVAKRLIAEGAVFLVETRAGEGRLEIVDDMFRVRRDGHLTSYFFKVETVTERRLAAESGADHGGDVAQ